MTRNLTYLDAFLNEHFEHEPMTSSTMTRAMTNSRHQQQQQQHYSRHKKIKASSRNINYSSQGNVVEQSLSSSMMINDCAFDESIDEGDGQQQKQREKKQKHQFYDGNVTSSSFEYTAAARPEISVKEKKTKKDVQEIISGKSSSLSSSDYASVYSGGSKVSNDAKTKLISTPEESIEYYDTNVIRQNKQKRLRSRRSSQPIPEHTNTYRDAECDQFVLFDEANFVELKNNMKKFHPDLYNSVPQFEDLSATEFYENPQYPLDYYDDEEDGETLINPYARMNASPTINKRQLAYDERGIQQQDYLEHYQQQLLTRDDENGIEANEYAMKRHRPRAMTSVNPQQHSNYNEKSLSTRDVYYNPTASTNDLHENGRGGKFPQYGHPHRVIVSKSKKQKGEVVLEYEC